MNFAQKVVRSFLWKTGLGRKTAERFWKKKKAGNGLKYLHYYERNVFEKLPVNFEDTRYNHFLTRDLKKWSVQEEYVLEMDSVIVEPERCLGIQEPNFLIEQTVVFTWDYQYPYILPYLVNRKKARVIETAVLYDGSATRNYYHHLVEALSSLYMLSKSDLPKDIPMIVNRFVYDQKFFQYLLKNNDYFRGLNWHIQEPGQWLKVKKLYRTKSLHFDKKTWDFTRSLYNIQDTKPFRKVFLSRDKKLYTRGLTNEQEVIDMLAKYGFETCYAEHLSVEDQRKLFQETEYLVALTGMGVIQQFFMNYDNAHVLEIIPINRLMPEYYCQAFTLGIKYYDVFLGEDIHPDKKDKNGEAIRYEGLKEYSVDIVRLEAAVVKMLEEKNKSRKYGNTYCPMPADNTTI